MYFFLSVEAFGWRFPFRITGDAFWGDASPPSSSSKRARASAADSMALPLVGDLPTPEERDRGGDLESLLVRRRPPPLLGEIRGVVGVDGGRGEETLFFGTADGL